MNMENIMTTTMNVAVDMITNNMNIITMTTTMNAAVDMIMRNMSIITTITTMNAVADMIIMIITIITQMMYLQAGDVRRLRNTQEKILKRSLRHCLRQKNMESSFVRKECFRQKTEHGSTLIWFRKKQRSVKVHRNTQGVSA